MTAPRHESPRTVIVVAHLARPKIPGLVETIEARFRGHGIRTEIVAADASRGHDAAGLGTPGIPAAVEVVMVLGGDGTFLRAAELARAIDAPVLGINTGHVGFLAEAEVENIDEVVDRVAARDFRVESRMTIDVVVSTAEGEIGRGWALNEASVENRRHRGVLEAIVEVDGRPVSAYGCDGVLVATPTGSTAYGFSAGGPVLWPELDAFVVVPNNAHALFARPLVVGPNVVVAVEIEPDGPEAMVYMDGYRSVVAPSGARIEVRRGVRPVHWAKLDERPFSDRLVRKFRLPVQGWRGHHGTHGVNPG